MSAPARAWAGAPPAVIDVDQLQIGDLLAEGGEGRVYTLPLSPHLVFKAYRRPVPSAHLEALVGWPGRGGPVVQAASAWPCTVVRGAGGAPAGLLVPRAPRRFSLRHRDGLSRLASLSYLTADPAHRAAAYGIDLPAPLAPERLGLVHALARLLAELESAEPAAGHGDLSTKNVLWSLLRGPEIFVIDCDNCELYPGGAARRRAMTPNWNDPAVRPGESPSRWTDRYSLGLIFLRIAGAANFPIQARQRASDRVEIEFPVAPGPLAPLLADPTAPLWALCARALSLADPPSRPPACAWVAALGSLLEGSPEASPADGAPPDVRIIPVPAPRRPAAVRRAVAAVSPSPPAPAPPPVPVAAPSPRVWPEVAAYLARFARWWWVLHAGMVRGGRRSRVRALAACTVVDFVLLVLVGAAVGLGLSVATGG